MLHALRQAVGLPEQGVQPNFIEIGIIQTSRSADHNSQRTFNLTAGFAAADGHRQQAQRGDQGGHQHRNQTLGGAVYQAVPEIRFPCRLVYVVVSRFLQSCYQGESACAAY